MWFCSCLLNEFVSIFSKKVIYDLSSKNFKTSVKNFLNQVYYIVGLANDVSVIDVILGTVRVNSFTDWLSRKLAKAVSYTTCFKYLFWGVFYKVITGFVLSLYRNKNLILLISNPFFSNLELGIN